MRGVRRGALSGLLVLGLVAAAAGIGRSAVGSALDLVSGDPTAGVPYTAVVRVPAPYGPGTLDETLCPDASFTYAGGKRRIAGRARLLRGANELEVTAVEPIVFATPGPAWIHLDLHCRYRQPGVKDDYYHLFKWDLTVQPGKCSTRSFRAPAAAAAPCRTGTIDVTLEWSAIPSTDGSQHTLSGTCAGSLTFLANGTARYGQTFAWHEDWIQTDTVGNRLEIEKDATGGNEGTVRLKPEVAYTGKTSYFVNLARRPPDFAATVEQTTTQSGPNSPPKTTPVTLTSRGAAGR